MQGLVSLAGGLGISRRQLRQGLRLPSIRINGSGQLPQWGRTHACYNSPTPADYTILLPDARGNDGREITFRMDSSLTKLVTLDGFVDQTINGSITRVMWANEWCRLIAEGGNWYKENGLLIPMIAAMHISANQSISTATVVKIDLNTSDLDNTSMMTDTANKRINTKRTGVYRITGKVTWESITATRCISAIFASFGGAASDQVASSESYGSATYVRSFANSLLAYTAGDYVELQGYHNRVASSNNALGGTLASGATQLNAEEILSW